MNIDTLNAHGGFGFNPEPRPSEGRRTITVAGARSLLPRPGPFEDSAGSPWPQVHASPLAQSSSSSPSMSPQRLLPPWRQDSARANEPTGLPARRLSLVGALRVSNRPGAIARERGWAQQPSPIFLKFHFRPQIGRDYPLNLSISLSGGRETNQDFPSNGE
ncbi:hypothetical protein RRG08_062990 [Elysia crispata]|uniref:Uncharacterized protein n=1 Tax=Elysia crispata TaxID=231223 RepID=A0AAE0YGP7_9GAST|nr:hypothetical protein RRG08_062945 [Elysia crispata]KAK3745133.1 hypothetical protein RRG08_062960 [Elysia crispata]KAK3745148.1 hypothetical protein RRG08_062975 [Elysia crispata]KAK3745163.1 hypothetical protein RRG08_062990 [Elysia crispata]